jgi:hypothetical protein
LEGKILFFFNFIKKEITINRRDKIYFLFENGERIVIEIINNPTLYCKDDLGLRYEAKERMIHEDLELFKKEKFHLWKVEKKSGTALIGGNEGAYEYSRKSELQTTIKQYADSYVKEVIIHVDNYQPNNKNAIEKG